MTARFMARVLSIGLALVVAGCASPQPSSQQPPAGMPPVGCFSVELDQCRAMAAGALASLPAEGPQAIYVQVGTVECDTGDCEQRGSVTIELRGAKPVAVTVDTVGGRVTNVTPVEVFLVDVRPSSQRLSQQVVSFDLGHCGIWSGIDVDGSFWDPVGAVTGNHPDAVNSAHGTFSLTSAGTATLRTGNGLILQLVRHEGPKYLPGCD